jgi:hypothetical protein
LRDDVARERVAHPGAVHLTRRPRIVNLTEPHRIAGGIVAENVPEFALPVKAGLNNCEKSPRLKSGTGSVLKSVDWKFVCFVRSKLKNQKLRLRPL